jgi:peptidoglycan/LPS O-acetylase OafA/YrhL
MASTAVRTLRTFYIPSLDGIRACAISLVFAAHAGLNDRVPGNFGVTTFFFLSGYLITTLLRIEFDRDHGISLKAFYLRRALRILPPMYLVLAAASLLTISGALEGWVDPVAALAQIFHLSNYYIISNGWWDGRAPGTWIYWSLAVEEHFYVVFPLVYLVLRRHARSPRAQLLTLLGLCALVLLWRLVLVYGLDAAKDRTYVASDTRVDSILFGCALAVYGNPVLDPTRLSALWWKAVLLPLGIAGLLVSFLVQDPGFEQGIRYTLQGIALVPLFVVAIRYPTWGVFRLLNVRPVKFLGVISYSLYLLHPTVLFALWQWTHLNSLAQGVLGGVVAIGLSTLIYYGVEKPAARLRKRLSRVANLERAPAVQTPAHARLGPLTRPLSEPPAVVIEPLAERA